MVPLSGVLTAVTGCCLFVSARYRSKVPFARALEAVPVRALHPAAGESGAKAKIIVAIGALIVQIQGREAGVPGVVPVAAADRQK